MKTLKKTLCLVLAVVMAVGVLVIPTSAAYDDFTDKDDIEHKEAVAVLTGMGVIAGKEDGSTYDPAGTLKREEAAKLVVVSLLGPDAAEDLDADAVVFSDVPTTNWANKYIVYAAQAGIINGTGDGTFNPTGTLTGYELAKLLLVATGVEGTFTGDNWKNEVMLAANKVGLLAGADITLSDAISRDDTAQLIWNAINYTPNGETKEYIVYADTNKDGKYSSGDKVFDTTDDPTTALVLKLAYEDEVALIHTETIREGSLGDVVFGLKDGSDEDEWGRTVKTYTNGKSGNDKVVFAEFNVSIVKTYSNEIKVDKILSDLGYKKGTKVNVTVVTNGVAGAKTTMERGTTDKVGGYGSYIEVTKSGDDIGIYVIDTFVHKLASTEVTEHKDATADDAEIDASVYFVNDDTGVEYHVTAKTDEFKKDDVVIYTANLKTGDIISIAKADTKTGKVTASGSNYIRIDGSDPVYLSKYAKEDDFVTEAKAGVHSFAYDPDNIYTYYLDFDGNVIGVGEGEAASEKQYVYVIAGQATVANEVTQNNLIDTGSATNTTTNRAVAQILNLDDGSVEIVDIAVRKANDGKYYYTTAKGTPDKTGPALSTSNGRQEVDKFYEYVVLDTGEYVLKEAAATVTPTVSIKKDTPTLGTDLYANNSTVTTVFAKDATTANKYNVTRFTGYNGFPETAYPGTASAKALVIANSNGIASTVYIVGASSPTTTKPVINYAVFTGVGEVSDVYHYNFVINGEAVVYESNDSKSYLNADAVGKVYNITVDGDVLDKAEKIEAKATGAKVTTNEGSYIITDKGLFYFDDDCVILDAGADYAVAEIAAKDVVTIYGTTADTAEFVVIAK